MLKTVRFVVIAEKVSLTPFRIESLCRQGLDGDVTLEDIIASRKGFMTDYEIDIARAYLEIPPRCRSPGSRRLDELDLTFRKRAATAASIRIDDSVSSVS